MNEGPSLQGLERLHCKMLSIVASRSVLNNYTVGSKNDYLLKAYNVQGTNLNSFQIWDMVAVLFPPFWKYHIWKENTEIDFMGIGCKHSS